MAKMTATVDKIIDRHNAEPGNLIAIFQDIMQDFKYLPKEAIARVVERLNIPLTQAYEVATFYNAFSLEPKGDHIINVCLGTACHLRGGPRILETFERQLKVAAGKTTKDSKFTLDTVNCLGACALAPLVKVDDNNHGNMSTNRVKNLITQYEK